VVCAWGLLAFGFFAIFSSIAYSIYLILGIILYGFFLIFDTQIIVARQGRYAYLSYDDYIIAALNLYLDIIILFIKILELIGDRRN